MAKHRKQHLYTSGKLLVAAGAAAVSVGIGAQTGHVHAATATAGETTVDDTATAKHSNVQTLQTAKATPATPSTSDQQVAPVASAQPPTATATTPSTTTQPEQPAASATSAQPPTTTATTPSTTTQPEQSAAPNTQVPTTAAKTTVATAPPTAATTTTTEATTAEATTATPASPATEQPATAKAAVQPDAELPTLTAKSHFNSTPYVNSTIAENVTAASQKNVAQAQRDAEKVAETSAAADETYAGDYNPNLYPLSPTFIAVPNAVDKAGTKALQTLKTTVTNAVATYNADHPQADLTFNDEAYFWLSAAKIAPVQPIGANLYSAYPLLVQSATAATQEQLNDVLNALQPLIEADEDYQNAKKLLAKYHFLPDLFVASTATPNGAETDAYVSSGITGPAVNDDNYNYNIAYIYQDATDQSVVLSQKIGNDVAADMEKTVAEDLVKAGYRVGVTDLDVELPTLTGVEASKIYYDEVVQAIAKYNQTHQIQFQIGPTGQYGSTYNNIVPVENLKEGLAYNYFIDVSITSYASSYEATTTSIHELSALINADVQADPTLKEAMIVLNHQGAAPGIFVVNDQGGDIIRQYLPMQSATVTLTHQTKTVTSTDPAGTDPTQLTRTVTMTTHFQDRDGNPLASDNVQRVVVTRTGTVDLVTGEVTYGPWSTGEFDFVATPDIPGYVCKSPGVQEVDTIDATTPDIEFTYHYDRIQPTHDTTTATRTINFVDTDGKAIADPISQTVTYKTTTDADGDTVYTAEGAYAAVDAPAVDGYFPGQATVAAEYPGASLDTPKNSSLTISYATLPLAHGSATSTRTINLVDDRGQTLAAPIVQTVTYKTVTDVDGHTVYTAVDHYDAVSAPTIAGYTAGDAQVAAEYPAASTATPQNTTATITYTKNAPVAEHDSVTSTRTIHFVDPDGNQLAASITQPVSYKTSTNATGETVYTAAGHYAAVTVPDVEGYNPTEATVPAEYLGAGVGTPQNSVVTVAYTPRALTHGQAQATRTISFSDDNGDQLADPITQTVTYKTTTDDQGQTVYTAAGQYQAVAAPEIAGYTADTSQVAALYPDACTTTPQNITATITYTKLPTTHTTGEATRTILFRSTDGAQLTDPVKQKATYKAATAADQTTYTFISPYAPYVVPEVTGYTPDQTIVPATYLGAGVGTPADEVVTVTYTKDAAVTPQTKVMIPEAVFATADKGSEQTATPQTKVMIPDAVFTTADKGGEQTTTPQTEVMIPDAVFTTADKRGNQTATPQTKVMIPEAVYTTADKGSEQTATPQTKVMIPDAVFTTADKGGEQIVTPQTKVMIPEAVYTTVDKGGEQTATPQTKVMIPDAVFTTADKGGEQTDTTIDAGHDDDSNTLKTPVSGGTTDQPTANGDEDNGQPTATSAQGSDGLTTTAQKQNASQTPPTAEQGRDDGETTTPQGLPATNTTAAKENDGRQVATDLPTSAAATPTDATTRLGEPATKAVAAKATRSARHTLAATSATTTTQTAQVAPANVPTATPLADTQRQLPSTGDTQALGLRLGGVLGLVALGTLSLFSLALTKKRH